MKLKFPRYVPYPLAWLRLLVNLIALCGMVLFSEMAWNNDVNTAHPFFWMICLLLMGFIGFIAHYPVRAILRKMGGVPSPSMIDSLWEGVLLVMVTVNSFLILLIAVSGLYYESILVNFADSPDFTGWDWQTSSQTDPTAGAWLLFFCYCFLAVYLYHLEYLVRQPQAIAIPAKEKKTKPPTKQSPKFKSSKPASVPLTPGQKRAQEIDQEIDRLKKKIENQERFGK